MKMTLELDAQLPENLTHISIRYLTLLKTTHKLHMMKLKLRPDCAVEKFMTSFMIALSSRRLDPVGYPIFFRKKISKIVFDFARII